MEEEDKIRYETLFYCQRLEDGFLSGDVARALFIRSKLPLPDLTKIWKLSDVSHDNKLDVFEFSIAMHLIEQKLCDQEIPKQLDSSVFANRTKEVIIPVMVKTEKNQLEKVFEQKDTNSQGYLERDVVQPLLLASRLSPSVLSKIWNIADLNRDGRLSFLEFAIALHLVKHCMKGVSLNGPVNPFLCIPEKENAIILYKEKLRIFDKEFLLEQKKRGTEETFSNSCQQLNDFDLDLLAEYLADTVPLNKGEKEIDHVDETSYHNASHVQSQEAEFEFGSVDISSKVKLCCEPTDNIECHRLTGNEISFDLEDIFQTVEEEKGNDFNEGLRYIAVRHVQSDIFSAVGDGMEDDDKVVDDVLPVPQKRTYFGKQLIFEDPIGSEIIGDVEFEVDFEAVIMDIEKECVDEERRLPIARVLPIYKSLPAANEEPFEKKTATKGTREIDLNFISDYNMNNERFNGLDKNGRDESSKLNKIIISNSVIDRITSESQDGGANEKKNKISFKESPGNDMIINNSKEVKDTKNTMKSREDDTLIDIVEQKRMIMQNQLEERKKLREKERNERLTVTQKSFPKEVSQKKEDGQEMTKNTSHVEESKETDKLNVGAKTFNHKMNEPNTEEEEKRREAEQREKLLLERITFLERKRQIILEKKLEKAKNANMHANTKSIDLWSQDSGKPPKESSEEEKKRLALALEIKRKNEAEMEKHREIELREAEKRRLEQMAKEEEERKGAEKRKRTFLENLAKLKQRVVTEEAMKSGLSNTTKSRSLKRGCFSTKDMSKGRADTQLSAKQHEFMKEINGNNTSFNHAEKQPDEIKKLQMVRQTDRAEELRRKEEDEIRREHFKSNREHFIKKVENEQEANAESSRREKIKKTRPKSYYGGMFNRSVHQIIDDTLLTRDESVNIENAPDFVDEEALAQCRREKEFRKEHERVSTHQRNLDRDASYTIENVEKLWEIDSGNVPQNGKKISDSSQKKGKTSSNPNRRSLVNTLTTEWNSFLEILEINDRKESETVKMRQEISAQRKKSTQGREKHAEIKHEVAKDTKCNSSKEIIQYHVISSTKSEQPDVESDLEKHDRNSGKVKKMVNSYKRSLSATYLLQQDVLRSPCTEPEKSDEDIQNESHDVHQTKQAPRERIVHVETNSRVHAQLREHEPLKCDDVNEIKRQQQKDIVKDNIPRRKSDLAHLWSDVVSHQ